MKKNIIMVIITLAIGIIFTTFILNKKDIYAKSEYNVFAFQVGAYENYDNAKDYAQKLPSSLIVKEDNLYKIYVAMYRNIDIVNKMIVYFENNGINIYLKNIKISRDFSDRLNNYEDFIINSEDEKVYNKINQSILNCYEEGSKLWLSF